MGLPVEITQSCSALYANPAGRAIHENGLHSREINHQPVITKRTAAHVVSAAADRRQQVVPPSEIDSGDNVGDARTTSDHPGVFVDACIPDLASLVVACIRWLIDLTIKSGAEGLDIDIGHGFGTGLYFTPRKCQPLGAPFDN